jgi:DGQHR domain-containing protein
MDEKIIRYSVNQVTQGEHRFYTITMPSDMLSKCCFVSTRDEDPKMGFQRVLDKNRAIEIAKYIDSGLGTIPNSIILSAQPEAELKIVGKGKTLQFKMSSKAFLILDGQHRVYGFSLSMSSLRVPVVIFNNLTRRDESRLFIDINSKQRGVPNELLLDIKQLAEYENSDEQLMRGVFDNLLDSVDSILLNRLAPASRTRNKISRVTFNSAFKPLIPLFRGRSVDDIYSTLNEYLQVFYEGLAELGANESFVNSTVFKAIMSFFPTAAAKLKDKYGADYTSDNFFNVLSPMFHRFKASKFTRPGNSYKVLVDHMESCLKTEFTL